MIVVAACDRPHETSTTTTTSTATTSATSTSSSLPVVIPSEARDPLPSGGFDALPIPNRNPTVALFPSGATSRRPVVIALHGTGDRPDWTCAAWRAITRERGWIVCPRGAHDAQWSTKNDERFTHREPIADLAAHIDLALDALAKKYAGYVDVDHPILAGFSMGAWQVLRIAARAPDRFTRIAIVEGGVDLAVANAKSLAAAHARVLFGSGQSDNAAAAKNAATILERAGVPARSAFAQVGHAFGPPLEEALAAQFAWLTEGDARWSAP